MVLPRIFVGFVVLNLIFLLSEVVMNVVRVYFG